MTRDPFVTESGGSGKSSSFEDPKELVCGSSEVFMVTGVEDVSFL